MGMFDKDKEIGLLLTNVFTQGDQFILWAAEITREDFPTVYGPSPQATLHVSRTSAPTDRMEVTTLGSAIVAKVRDAEPDDFPAVVFWREAPSDRSRTGKAQVLQFVKAWGNVTNPTDPATVAAQIDLGDDRPPVGDDDIPF